MTVANLEPGLNVRIVHKPAKLYHRLARQDDLDIHRGLLIKRRVTQSQAMTIGRHCPNPPGADLQHEAIEIITHVLLRHRKLRLVDQSLHDTDRQNKRLTGLGRFDTWIVLCWKHSKRVTTPTGT